MIAELLAVRTSLLYITSDTRYKTWLLNNTKEVIRIISFEPINEMLTIKSSHDDLIP